MKIKKFVDRSLGEWDSMRSTHSLAFKQFDQTIGLISIEALPLKNPSVEELLAKNKTSKNAASSPFSIRWKIDSESSHQDNIDNKEGECILVPIPSTNSSGIILRSIKINHHISVRIQCS